MVPDVTTIHQRFTTEWAALQQPEAIPAACSEVGYLVWRHRVLTPVTTMQPILLQILHGNTACSPLSHGRFHAGTGMLLKLVVAPRLTHDLAQVQVIHPSLPPGTYSWPIGGCVPTRISPSSSRPACTPCSASVPSRWWISPRVGPLSSQVCGGRLSSKPYTRRGADQLPGCAAVARRVKHWPTISSIDREPCTSASGGTAS
jgi:hypothetical protein